jgi:hypothetical protein
MSESFSPSLEAPQARPERKKKVKPEQPAPTEEQALSAALTEEAREYLSQFPVWDDMGNGELDRQKIEGLFFNSIGSTKKFDGAGKILNALARYGRPDLSLSILTKLAKARAAHEYSPLYRTPEDRKAIFESLLQQGLLAEACAHFMVQVGSIGYEEGTADQKLVSEFLISLVHRGAADAVVRELIPLLFKRFARGETTYYLSSVLAKELIKAGQGQAVAENQKRFVRGKTGTDPEVAQLLVQEGYEEAVASSLSDYHDYSLAAAIAERLMAAGYSKEVKRCSHKFEKLPAAAVRLLINEDWRGADIIQRAIGLDPQELNDLLIAQARKGKTDFIEPYSKGDMILGDAVDDVQIIDVLAQRQDIVSIIKMIAGRAIRLKKGDELKPLSASIAKLLIIRRHAENLTKHWDQFEQLDSTEFLNLILETGQAAALQLGTEPLRSASISDWPALIDRIYKLGNLDLVANLLDKMERVPRDMVPILIAVGHSGELTANAHRLEGFTPPEFARELIQQGYAKTWAENINPEDYTSEELIQLATLLCSSGTTGVLAQNIEKFPKLPKSIAEALLADKQIEAVYGNPNQFEISRRELQGLFKVAVENTVSGDPTRSLSSLVAINQRTTPPLLEQLSQAAEIFGTFLDGHAYNLFNDAYNGRSTPELQALGVTEQGAPGLAQLKERIQTIRREIVLDSFDPELVLAVPTLQRLFRSYIGYDEKGGFGQRNDKAFAQVVRTHVDLKKAGKIKPLAANYQPSQVLPIKLARAPEQNIFKLTETTQLRYGELISSLERAHELCTGKRPFSVLKNEASLIRQTVINRLRANIQDAPNEKAKSFITKRIGQLEAVDFGTVKNFQETLLALSEFREFQALLLTGMFVAAYTRYPDRLEHPVAAFNKRKPTFDDVSWLLDFADHITKQETIGQFVTDRRARQALRKAIGTKFLAEEYTRAQSGETLSTRNFRFVPSRGIMLEFSGHAADACWAEKVESIGKEFPNISAVTIVQNAGEANERVAGSMLLIESKSLMGKPLLIIRGLNPRETNVNQLSVPSFVENLVSYLESMAQSEGRELAIVIDGHQGGAASNRGVVFDYLESIKPHLKQVIFRPGASEETTFNGYGITTCTYQIDSASLATARSKNQPKAKKT